MTPVRRITNIFLVASCNGSKSNEGYVTTLNWDQPLMNVLPIGLVKICKQMPKIAPKTIGKNLVFNH